VQRYKSRHVLDEHFIYLLMILKEVLDVQWRWIANQEEHTWAFHDPSSSSTVLLLGVPGNRGENRGIFSFLSDRSPTAAQIIRQRAMEMALL
jgi:hypothetical protein